MACCPKLLVTTAATAVFMFASIGRAQSNFAFRQVARTGDVLPGLSSPIASFGHWVSMNDDGKVGFKATLLDGSQAVVRAVPKTGGGYDFEIVETADGTTRLLGDYVGINGRGEVSYRLRVVTPDALFSIRRDTTSVAAATNSTKHFRSLLSATDVSDADGGMVSFFGTAPEGASNRQQIRKGNGAAGNELTNSLIIASQPIFISLNQYTSISENGQVVFTGSHAQLGTGVFVGDGTADPRAVATLSEFSSIGSLPSINNAGEVAFYAAKTNGQGIFIGGPVGTPSLIIPVQDPVLAIDPSSRVALNNRGDVAFMGSSDGGRRALFYSFRRDWIALQDCDASRILVLALSTSDSIAVSSSLSGIQRTPVVDDIQMWDGLNSSGQIAVWSHHIDATEGVYVWTCSLAVRLKKQKGLSSPLGEPRCGQQIPEYRKPPSPEDPNYGVLLNRYEKWKSAYNVTDPDCQHGGTNQWSIAAKGCGLTCLTMIYNYVKGVDWGPIELNSKPVFANAYESEPHRIITNDISPYWFALYLSDKNKMWNAILLPPRIPLLHVSTCQIVSTICGKRVPVLLRVRTQTRYASGKEFPFHHYVLCYGLDPLEEDVYRAIQIHDPFYNQTNLGGYSPVGGESRVDYAYAFEPATHAGAFFRGDCPAELLLTDAQGRRTGYDPSTGQLLQDIPGVTYITAWDDDLDPPEDLSVGRESAHKIADIAQSVEGTIAVDIHAIDDGWISMQWASFRAAGPMAHSGSELLGMQVGDHVRRWVAASSRTDFDNDGDVDKDDFAFFQTCVSGPAIPQNDHLCHDADYDVDGDVDMDDFGIFQGCYSGGGKPVDPVCAQ